MGKQKHIKNRSILISFSTDAKGSLQFSSKRRIASQRRLYHTNMYLRHNWQESSKPVYTTYVISNNPCYHYHLHKPCQIRTAKVMSTFLTLTIPFIYHITAMFCVFKEAINFYKGYSELYIICNVQKKKCGVIKLYIIFQTQNTHGVPKSAGKYMHWNKSNCTYIIKHWLSNSWLCSNDTVAYIY